MTTTISGSSGIVFPDLTSMQTGQQAVKAWVNFNGTGTVAIRAGYNVSSITDNGVGVYNINLITNMIDTNYAVVSSSRNSGLAPTTSSTAPSTVSQAFVNTLDSNFTNVDANNISLTVFR
jgi:hypothetical protein